MTLPKKLLRHAATLTCGVALAGCAAVQVEELLASTTIVAELKVESGTLVEAARFSAGHAGDAPPGDWGRFVVSPFATKSEYALVESDPGVPSRSDSPARVIVAFHGDVKRLDIGERFALALYHALTGDKMPYAIIMYSWASDAPVGTITSNDQTDKIQTIVVGGGIGEWREFRRNVLEDYRRAFGEEPWDIVAVGVMTDTSNTRGKASAQYGDISFRPAE